MHADRQAYRLAVALEAREDFYYFARRMFYARKGFRWLHNWHHAVICDALMRVYRGECKRLIINIPPRYSKTDLAVVNFIAWTLGRHPDAEYIHATYSGTLADNNAAAVKAMVESDAYREVFPEVVLRRDFKSRGDWRTTAGGVVYACGEGGTITGFGAGKMRPGFGGAIVIDDPHKADEARSDVIRKGVIDWFQNTLESRKNGRDTPIILIMQRLHEEDLAGWLINGGNGEEWEVLKLSAIQEDGTALWPEKHDIATLRKMQQAAPYVFAGQYQQEPTPGEGGTFKPDMLEVVDAVPAGVVKWVRGWDLGSTTDGDPTAGVRLGMIVTPTGPRFIVSDVVHGLMGPDDRDAAIKNTAARDGLAVMQSLPQDPGQAGKSQVVAFGRLLAGLRFHTSPESGDKVTRAELIAAQVNVGNVLMVRAPWNDALINEMRLFPFGKNDDRIDALSRAFAKLIEGTGVAALPLSMPGL